MHGFEIRDSGDDNRSEVRQSECCWAALLVIGHQAPKPRASFFFIFEDLQDLQRGLIVAAHLRTFPPFCPDPGPCSKPGQD